MVEKYIKALKKLALSDEPNLGGADTVLGMLWGAIMKTISMTTRKSKLISMNYTGK